MILLIGAVLVLVAAAIFLLVRTLQPLPEPVLRLSPAAAAADAETLVLLTGTGWVKNEDVAICAVASGDDVCDASNALIVIQADRHGAIAADVLAGPLLGQGMTTFVAAGLESGQVATRSFRVLRTADDHSTAALVTPEAVNGQTQSDSDPVVEATATDSSGASGNAWRAEYFSNPDLAGAPAVVRDDLALDFNWEMQAPDPAVPADGFSARWSRRLPFEGGRYRFVAETSGGVRIVVDDRTVVDQWQDGGSATAATGIVELAAGEHEVVVSFVDLQGPASLAVRWEAYDTFADWRGEYFANPDLAGEPALIRDDLAVDFNWADSSPAPGLLPADEFSVRWTRSLPFAAGPYRFSITADDGARLLVDNLVLVDAWNGSSGLPVTADTQLSAGDHQIAVVFYDNAGPARVSVGWSPIVAAPPGLSPSPTAPETPATPEGTLTPTATPGALPEGTATPTTTGDTPTWTPTVPPGSTPTPTPTAPPGSTPTPTITVPPGSTSTPTPTTAPTAPPGSTSTPTPTATNTVPPQLDLGLDPPEGQVNDEITVVVSGQWTPTVTFYVVLLPRGMTIPPPVGQPISILATGTTSNDGSERRVTFSVPNDPQLLGVQPIQLVVYTDGWNQWEVEPFTILE